MKNLTIKKNYQKLIDSVGNLLQQARQKAFQQVNSILVKTYWEIGRHVVVYEQENQIKAEYGSKLLDQIAHDLKARYGKGFSRSNVIYMRLLYIKYTKSQTLSDQLSWSHYVELLGISDDLARSFYEKECAANRWSVRELERQINSMLFERLALSKDKAGILKLAAKGQKIEKAEDVIKNPYVLEFLGMPENYRFTEKELEQKVIDNMQHFLLELGKGFSFVARQFRITLDDHEPVGIVLGTKKDHALVEYALGGITNKLFASKYRLSLPDKGVLQKTLENIIARESRRLRLKGRKE